MLFLANVFELGTPLFRKDNGFEQAAALINSDPALKKALLSRFLKAQLMQSATLAPQDVQPSTLPNNEAPLGKVAQYTPGELVCKDSASGVGLVGAKDWTRSPRTLWSLEAAEQWLRPDMEPTPVSPSAGIYLPNRRQLKCVLEVSRAQFREDLVLLPYLLYIAGKTQIGTFVEIGAYDGITYSNTLALELCFGWTGLLIEANPANAAKLAATQQQYRVRSRIRHAAVCSVLGGTADVTVEGGAVAGQPKHMSPGYRAEWAHLNHPEKTVPVPCEPMAALMAEARLPHANFLSLDVEGAELAVLETAAPDAFDLVLVEMDGHDKEKDRRVHCLLESWGLHRQTAFPFGSIFHSQVYLRDEPSF